MARRGYLCLILLAFPAYAQAPDMPIVVSPEERAAIIAKFGELQDALERAQKSARTCWLAHSA